MNQYLHINFYSFGKIWFFQMLINFLVTFPIIFNFYLIPKIEKRLGEKLKYVNPIYKLQVFSRWFMPPFDIGPAILIDYLILKFTGKAPGKIWGYNKNSFNALRQIHYDIRDATDFEIFIAFVVSLELFSFFCMMVVYWVNRI